jgi:Kef-type K+ transport system membrane component KefB
VTSPLPVPPVGGHVLFLFLFQVGSLLLVARLLGQLAVRLSMPAVVGELLTGVVLGPSLLGQVAPDLAEWLFPRDTEQFHLLDSFGQIGVILLVGITGLQLDVGLVRRRATIAARISLPGVLIPLGLGIGVGHLLPGSLLSTPDRNVFALFLGIAMCVSAVPVIAKTLMDLKLFHRNIGQLILISATVDDIIGWAGLSIVTAMATTGLRAADAVQSIGYLLIFGCAVALVGRPVIPAVMRSAARSEDPGTALAMATAIILLCGATTHLLGLEAILGALAAGILIRASGGEVLRRLAPLRAFVASVLAPVFFAIAGLRIDLAALAEPAVFWTALLLLVIAIVGKFTGACIGALISRLNRWEAIALGAGMNARGVVEVVVAMVGLRLGVLNLATYTMIVLIAVVTSLMGPPILRVAMRRLEVTAEERLRAVDRIKSRPY